MIITGAGGGIGRAIALAVAAEGADLVVTDGSQAVVATAETAREAKVRATPRRADVSQMEDMTITIDRHGATNAVDAEAREALVLDASRFAR